MVFVPANPCDLGSTPAWPARHKKVTRTSTPRLVARLDALTGGAAAANERVPVLVTLDGDVGALDAAVAAAPGQCATSTTIRVGAVSGRPGSPSCGAARARR